jgi:hypothetical protein
MATTPPKVSGIGSLPAIIRTLEGTRRFDPPPIDDTTRKYAQAYRDFLGTTDYDAQLKESQDLAKLQIALAMAQRGFAGMSAQPQRGESPIGTLGRTLFSPLAGDIAPIAGRLMQQRQAAKAAEAQEDRAIKLAAFTGAASARDRLTDAAIGLIPKAPVDTLTDTVRYVLKQNEENKWEFVPQASGKGRTQVRLQKGTGNPYDIQSNELRPLVAGETVSTAADLGKYGLSLKSTEDAKKPIIANLPLYVQKWVKNKDGKRVLDPVRQYAVRRTIGTGTDAKTRVILPGDDEPDKAITIGDGIGHYKIIDPESAGPTDADRSRVDRKNLLLSFMNHYQDLQLKGKHSAYSARSALFFDQGAYLAGKSPWKFIPPGTDPADRTQDVTITNPDVLKLIQTEVDSVAQQFLKREWGDASKATKSSMLAKAVRSILSRPPETVFGATPIPVIGERNGEKVGYSPTAAARGPAAVVHNAKEVMATLKSDAGADADAAVLFSKLAYPDNKEDLNKPWGRAKVAVTAFPGAFGNLGTVGTDTYDFEKDQQRRDVEGVLSNVRLPADAMPDEHKAVIQNAVIKKAAARDTLQNSVDARLAREGFGYALEFRRALLNFKNAAAESNVEGFFTGTGAGIAARLGFDEWITSEEGAEHWRRLSIASTRLQNGISRRVGKDFGDNRISNYDAEAYKKLVADIRSAKGYNRILVEDGLERIDRDLTDLMAYGGKVGWTKRDLRRAAEAGVDFSALSTQMDWHGHGYYGENRYRTTRQRTPSLTEAQRSAIRTEGQLKDTLYGGEYTVPSVDYLTDNIPTFTQGKGASKGTPAVEPTAVNRMDPDEFRFWLEGRAKKAGLSGQAGIAEMRRRVVRGILRYNFWRNNLK